MTRLKVFLSSEMTELHDVRETACRALEDAGFEVIRWEGLPAQPRAPSATFEDGVREADVYVGIFWNKYSEPTAREYRIALQANKPCFIYLREPSDKRDNDLRNLIEEEFQRQLKYKTFWEQEKIARYVAGDINSWIMSEWKKAREQIARLEEWGVSLRNEGLQRLLVLKEDEEFSVGEPGKAIVRPLEVPALRNCEVTVEFRFDDYSGNNINWFGIRVRGVSSYFHVGYLVYMRANGKLDITSHEEKSILLDGEVTTSLPIGDFVKLKLAVISDQITVWINDVQKITLQNNLVMWPGKVYLHTFGTKVTVRSITVFQ